MSSISYLFNSCAVTPAQQVTHLFEKAGRVVSSICRRVVEKIRSVFDQIIARVEHSIVSWRKSREVRVLKVGIHQQTFEQLQACQLPEFSRLLPDLQSQVRSSTLERQVAQLVLAKGATLTSDIFSSIQQVVNGLLVEEETPTIPEHLQGLCTIDELHTLLEKVDAEAPQSEHLSGWFDEFQIRFEKLRASLQTPAAGDGTTKLNAVIKNLRALANSSFYSTLWMCDEIPEIAAMHELVQSLYTKGVAGEMYAPLGELATGGGAPEASLPERILGSINRSYDNGFEVELLSPDTLVQNADRVVEASKAVFSWMGKYDPIRGMGNTPCSLYREQVEESSITCVMAASPTLGTSISPEMHVMLRFLENNFFKVLQGQLPKTTPTHWNYCNLQALGGDSLQFKRSKAILEAQKQYPFSFSAFSVALNSPFHMDGVFATSAENMVPGAICAQKSQQTVLGEVYAETLLSHIIHEDNFSLNPTRNNPNAVYFFDIKDDEEKIAFQATVKELIEKCFKLAQRANSIRSAQLLLGHTDHPDEAVLAAWVKKAIFRELVHLALVRYFQLKKLQSTPGELLATTACMESIDRGNKLSNQMLWALFGDQASQTIFDTFHGRPLIGGGRFIMTDRALSFLALTSGVNQQKVQKLLEQKVPELI